MSNKKRPTGFIAQCQCGNITGALDFDRTERKEAGKILGAWLFDGHTVIPKFEESWEAPLKCCTCEPVDTESTG